MRLELFLLPIIVVCVSSFAAGLYAGVRRIWPVTALKRLIYGGADPRIQKDRFGRLLAYPGKKEIACPVQDETTAVLLVMGQSNAGNHQGQRHQSMDDRIVNFVAGRCYRAASPLLGADGEKGETWTLLGGKLIQSGLYRNVILIPASVGGSSVRRWAKGGDLNKMMVAAIRSARTRYRVTAVLWDQGATDFNLRTSEEQYRSKLKSVIDTVRAEGVDAPFFITRCSRGGKGWSEDNPVARAQASLADARNGIFDGPNTDRDLTAIDFFDGYHFGASGQEKFADAWLQVLRAAPRP